MSVSGLMAAGRGAGGDEGRGGEADGGGEDGGAGHYGAFHGKAPVRRYGPRGGRAARASGGSRARAAKQHPLSVGERGTKRSMAGT
ncbi:hypothetical protein GCM10023324_30080 [Streptomyces youssoufiensis]